MTNWAIVAIPKDDADVWKYSSEKIPHLTLLFLGDQEITSDFPRIAEYVAHVAKTALFPFGMTVDRRGKLGADEADVLFFEKDRYDRAGINRARDHFLRDPEIKKMYDSTEQYPDWIPHLTLGYPDKPAKKIESGRVGFYYVEFDRIALWTDDYSGPEFRLERREFEEVDMMMSEQVNAILEHYGVKGMKWGVRRDRGHEGERATNKKIAKLDKNFDKAIETANKGRLTPELYNTIVRRMNARIDELNDSPKYRDVDLSTYSGKIKTDYERDSKDVIMRSFEDGVREIYGSNASGTKKAVYNRETDRIDIVEKNAKHAENTPVIPDVSVFLKRNKTGHIVSQELRLLDKDLKQSDVIEDFLAHYGIPGMKWGVRRGDSVPAGETRATQKRR